jgi:hypothetical protein
MNDELSPAERDELQTLRREVPPPPAMEAELLARLSREGLIARRASRRYGVVLAAAAAAGIFALGLAAGGALRRTPTTTAPVAAASPRYVLFVESPVGESMTDEQMMARVKEYRGWSVRMRSEGHGLGGEKLADGGWSLLGDSAVALGPPSEGFVLGGYFLLQARDDAQALEIARTHPHLKHGGRMVLRRIEDV